MQRTLATQPISKGTPRRRESNVSLRELMKILNSKALEKLTVRGRTDKESARTPTPPEPQ